MDVGVVWKRTHTHMALSNFVCTKNVHRRIFTSPKNRTQWGKKTFFYRSTYTAVDIWTHTHGHTSRKKVTKWSYTQEHMQSVYYKYCFLNTYIRRLLLFFLFSPSLPSTLVSLLFFHNCLPSPSRSLALSHSLTHSICIEVELPFWISHLMDHKHTS